MRAVLRRVVSAALLMPLHAYRLFVSPVLGRNCRFEPSCSAYAIGAIRVHGPIRGLWLAARRVSRCHPWSAGGADPVPDLMPDPAQKPPHG